MNTDPSTNAEPFKSCKYPAGHKVWHLTHSPEEPKIPEWWPFTHFGTLKAAEGVHNTFLTKGEPLGWKGRQIPPAWITEVQFQTGPHHAIRWANDVGNADASGWIAYLWRSSNRTDEQRNKLWELRDKSVALKRDFGDDLFLRDIPSDPATYEEAGKCVKEAYAKLLREAFEVIGLVPPDLILYLNEVEGDKKTTSYLALSPGLVSSPGDWQRISGWQSPRPWSV